MNIWTEKSVIIAQRYDYLDRLYEVYPISPNSPREIGDDFIANVKKAYEDRDSKRLVKLLLEWELFPIKDSYVPFLKKNKRSVDLNPKTIDRIAAILYSMGFDEVIKKCVAPKETNRQIGPMFKEWVNRGTLGVPILFEEKDVLDHAGNCVFSASDNKMKRFAEKHLGYTRNKGLDFIAKFNHNYIIAEAKFLTDFGGHQNAQFDDAISTLQTDFSHKNVEEEIVPIAIMDGVLYINSNNKMYNYLKQHTEQTIISSLLLGDFLKSL